MVLDVALPDAIICQITPSETREVRRLDAGECNAWACCADEAGLGGPALLLLLLLVLLLLSAPVPLSAA